MRKFLKVFLTVIMPTVFLIIVGFYVFILKTTNLPYKNYSDFSTGSAYVYSKVSFGDSTLLTVMPNSDFYGNLKHYVYNDKYNSISYLFKISTSNLFDIPICVDKEFYNECKYTSVDIRLVEFYNKIDIPKSSLINGNRLQDSLTKKEESALIYVLLKNKLMNCYNDCESGIVILSEP